MNKNKGNKLIKTFFGFSMASWISAAVSFLLTPIITRVICPAELGKIDMFVTYCNMFIYASTLGMHQSYMRFFEDLPEGFTKDKLLSFSIIISSIGAIGAGIICCMGYKHFSNAILGKTTLLVSILMACYIFSYGFLDIIKTKPRMYGQTIKYAVIVISISVGTKLAYLSYIMTHCVLATIVVLTCIVVIIMLFNLFKNKESIFVSCGKVGKESYISILRYALPTVPVMFISNVNTSVPKLLINRYCDSATVGVYAGALTIVQIISLLQVGINTFWSPYVFKNFKEKKIEIQQVHRIISFGIVLFGLCLLVFQDVLFLILGSSYRSSKNFYALLLASPIFYTIGETVGIGIGIKKKTYWNIITTGISLLMNLLLGLMLVPRYGNIGAAISVSISAGVMVTLKSLIGERYYKVVTNPIKTWGASGIYVLGAIATMIYSENRIIRSIILLVLMVLLVVVYISEFKMCITYIKTLLFSVSKKKNEEEK